MLGFDARAARLMADGEHIAMPGAPGLRLVARGARRTWTYRYKSPVDSLMKQVKLGDWPAMGPAAALAAWQAARDQRATGADPGAARRKARADQRAAAAAERVTRRRSSYTVRRLVDEHLAWYRGTVAPKTYRELERLFGRELDAVAELPAADVTRSTAFELIGAMRDRPVVARALRQGLGAAWDHALDAGRLPPETPNWWRLILRGKLPSKGKPVRGERRGVHKRVLSAPELGALLRWLPNFTCVIEDALVLYLWTCCRGSEIVAMERREISREVDGLWWTIPVAKLKMRRNSLTVDLRVPLAGRAAQVVERRLEATTGDWLFPSRGRSGHLEQKAVGVAVWVHMPECELRPEWVRPRLPVANWAPHDLRRTGRTLLASIGCPDEVGEAILGHRPPGVMAVYNRHQYDAERRLWLQRLAERLEASAAG